MDIPLTGAIFTLGQSHLADNSQSYFYIKNDPVRRLVSGLNQSAVICESGRLFVWGENTFGQLGIGTNGGNNVVTKPTCVKSLKILGLKICDITFGFGWSAIITHSNEVFYCGRNIFDKDTRPAANFTKTNVGGEKCSLIRKPIRLEEFDDLITSNEQQESYKSVLAGNEHFAVLTSMGRLFGWGANSKNQLGINKPILEHPIEMIVGDEKIKSFTCGPQSTLILTESEKLYLTGQLNNYHFSTFTQLQKNLSNEEDIITCMYISQGNEVYIITECGSIYRSSESNRHQNLIFQKFYDYDSEDYGPIEKLLKGTSFFAALTKSKKFFTTFSESGHHLKTFREISKFKNIKAVDMSVGEKHILVLGVPKGSAKNLNKTFVMPNDMNGNLKQLAVEPLLNAPNHDNILEEPETTESEENDNNNHNCTTSQADIVESIKPNTPIHQILDNEVKQLSEDTQIVEVEEKIENTTLAQVPENLTENLPTELNVEIITEEAAKEITNDTIDEEKIETKVEQNDDEKESENNNKSLDDPVSSSSSPTKSLKSRKGSGRSIKFDENVLTTQKSSELVHRPRTPYPDSSSSIETPQTVKRVAPNTSDEELLEKTSPAFNDSLENTPDLNATIGNVKRRPSLKYADRGLKQEKIEQIQRKLSSEDGELSNVPKGKYIQINDIDMDDINNINDNDEEDEKLIIEIKSSIDPLDKTVNQIRFINNGIDVTDNIKHSLDKSGSSLSDEEPQIQTKKETLDDINTIKEENTNDMPISPNVSIKEISEDDMELQKNNCEDDERTTASVNSNATQTPVDMDINEITKENVEKVALNDNIIETSKKTEGTVRKFLTDIRNKSKNLSCRNEKSIQIEDEPPKYTPMDEHLEDAIQNQHTSKVCVIL